MWQAFGELDRLGEGCNLCVCQRQLPLCGIGQKRRWRVNAHGIESNILTTDRSLLRLGAVGPCAGEGPGPYGCRIRPRHHKCVPSDMGSSSASSRRAARARCDKVTIGGASVASTVRMAWRTSWLRLRAPPKDHDDSPLLLESYRAVAFAMDDILLFGLIANSKDPASLQVVGDSLQVEPYACMVRKDDPEFKKLVDGTLNRMMKSGEFTRLYTKWFMSPIPPKGVNLNLPMSAELKDNLKAMSEKPAM